MRMSEPKRALATGGIGPEPGLALLNAGRRDAGFDQRGAEAFGLLVEFTEGEATVTADECGAIGHGIGGGFEEVGEVPLERHGVRIYRSVRGLAKGADRTPSVTS